MANSRSQQTPRGGNRLRMRMQTAIAAVARPVSPAASETGDDTTAERSRLLPTLWKDGIFWLCLGLTLFAVAPFLQPGYFWGANDARHHVYFLFEFDRLVQDGIWWPRWSPDFAFGYGYPFFNIYGPLSHFLAELLLHFAHFSYTGAIESIFVLSIAGSAAAMYVYARSLAGRGAGLLAALVYTYAPYHLLDLYVRANLAECMAFVWLPLCLWTFRESVRRPSWVWILGAAVSYAGLMVTSNLIFVLFSPLLMLYVLVLIGVRVWSQRSLQRRLMAAVRAAVAPALGGIAGLGLSAVFWIPMVLERQYVRVDQWFDGRYNLWDDFLYWFQLFSPRWGFGTSQAGPNDPMGFQIGGATLILATVGALLAWRRRKRLGPEIGLFALAALISALLTLQPFTFLWQLPVVGTVLQLAQFPWRWLTITTLGLSILAGLVATGVGLSDQAADTGLDLPLLALAAVVVMSSYPLLRVEIVPPAEGPVGLAALMRFERDADEMTGSTAWVKEIPTWSSMAEYYVDLDQAGQPVTPVTSKVDYSTVDYQNLAVGSVAHNTVMEEVYFCTDPGAKPGDCSPRDDQQIVFNQFYYPGWHAYLLDGQDGKVVRQLPIVPEGCVPASDYDPVRDRGRKCPPFPAEEENPARLAATLATTEVDAGPLGRMIVPLPAVGEGYVLLRYEDTPPRTVGKWISVATAIILALMAMVLGVGPRFLSVGRLAHNGPKSHLLGLNVRVSADRPGRK